MYLTQMLQLVYNPFIERNSKLCQYNRNLLPCIGALCIGMCLKRHTSITRYITSRGNCNSTVMYAQYAHSTRKNIRRITLHYARLAWLLTQCPTLSPCPHQDCQ